MLKKNGLLGLVLILAVFAIGVGLSTLNVNAQTAEDCSNGADDDDDKLVDCDDPNCDADPKCGTTVNTCTEAVAAGLLPLPPNDGKVTLCHFTGSGSNPFIINTPSLSALDPHQGHHGDCAKFFDGTVVCGL